MSELNNLNTELEDTDFETVSSVQFGLVNPEEIRRGSVVEVKQPEPYEGNKPKQNGLFDLRMGTIEFGRTCATCGNKSIICPGHFGHIELGLPVYYFHHLLTVLKLLRCVCYHCSKLLVDKSDPMILNMIKKKAGANRFTVISSIAQKTKVCQYNEACRALQPSRYFKVMGAKMGLQGGSDNVFKLFAEFKQEAFTEKDMKKKIQITPQRCHRIFSKITREDYEFLGFSHNFAQPSWLICTTLPVPPPAVRPSVRQDNNQRSEDDLTHILAMIIKKNIELKHKLEENCDRNVVERYHGALQYNVTTFFDNDINGIPTAAQRSGRPLKAVKQRLKGKEGRLRLNLMGKRVDFSARTVIGADPNLSIDQFGVPKMIAMNLTFPEIVTKYNIKEMYKLIHNGPENYPGAKSVKLQSCVDGVGGCTKVLKYTDSNTIRLKPGDVVNRHLIDGDIILVNRQPTLHRPSMLGMRVKVLEGKTFRLNVFCTKPLNADFDGDIKC